VKIWNTSTGALLRTITGHSQAVVSVAYSPDGSLIASSGDDCTARLWRADDGAEVHRLTGGASHVYAVAFSGDGEWLASAGQERNQLGSIWKHLTGNRFRWRNAPTIRIWRVQTGALVQQLAFHRDNVWSIAVSRDSRWLASNSEDGTTALWRMPG
jgi:Tol biopolymer transport system component